MSTSINETPKFYFVNGGPAATFEEIVADNEDWSERWTEKLRALGPGESTYLGISEVQRAYPVHMAGREKAMACFDVTPKEYGYAHRKAAEVLKRAMLREGVPEENHTDFAAEVLEMRVVALWMLTRTEQVALWDAMEAGKHKEFVTEEEYGRPVQAAA